MANLKDLREQTGRTQEDIASEFGISRKYLSQLENNRRKSGRKLAEKIAAFYHISPAEILGYRIGETQRTLMDERNLLKSRLEQERIEHAREIQALQLEIERLKKENEDLHGHMKHLEEVGAYLMRKSSDNAESDAENV